MSYIGKAAQLQGAYDKADSITFNGTVGPYNILVGGVARAVGKATNIIVFINNVYFKPYTDYNVSGSTITFTSSQAAQPNHSIVILGDVFQAPSVVATNLDSLTDVVAGSPSVNDILKWNGSNWINSVQGTYVISNNTDVDTAGAVNGDKLVYDGTEWVPQNDDLGDLNDVIAPAPTDNQVLTWDAGISKWIAQNPASTVVAINDLSDVDTSVPPNNNQVLTWVSASNQWKPVNTQTTITTINGLTDVDTASVPPSNGQVLTWNSTTSQWTPGNVEAASVNVSLDNLTDVVIGTPIDGQALVYDADTSNWIPGVVAGSGGGASVINDLTDVDTASVPPTNGQSLVWNSVTSQWRPLTITGGGGGGALDDLTDVDTVSVAPTDGQALVWDSGESLWVPGTIEGGGTETIPDYVYVYVGSTGSDTTGDGSSGAPFQSLYKAGTVARTLKAKVKIYIWLTANESYYLSNPTSFSNIYGTLIEIASSVPAVKSNIVCNTPADQALTLGKGSFIFSHIRFRTTAGDPDNIGFYVIAEGCDSLIFSDVWFGDTADPMDLRGRGALYATKCNYIEFDTTRVSVFSNDNIYGVYIEDVNHLHFKGASQNWSKGTSTDTSTYKYICYFKDIRSITTNSGDFYLSISNINANIYNIGMYLDSCRAVFNCYFESYYHTDFAFAFKHSHVSMLRNINIIDSVNGFDLHNTKLFIGGEIDENSSCYVNFQGAEYGNTPGTAFSLSGNSYCWCKEVTADVYETLGYYLQLYDIIEQSAIVFGTISEYDFQQSNSPQISQSGTISYGSDLSYAHCYQFYAA